VNGAPFDSIVFDLDGTLWDTCESCALGWNNVLDRHAISFRRITADDVRGVAGRPHDACIRDVFVGLSEAELAILIEHTQTEDNRIVAERGGALYPGVMDNLLRLSERYPLFIVSNCQAGYIETFLKVNALSHRFRDFECWGNTGLTKAQNFQRVIDRNRLRAPLFVGDTEGDRQAAEACNAPFVHAAYGFGSCDANARVESFAELTDQLLAR
jgi:phosphoglycolate phosphatase